MMMAWFDSLKKLWASSSSTSSNFDRSFNNLQNATVTINPLSPPPPLIHPKPIAALTLSDFLRGKRLRNPTKDFYFPRAHDAQIASHLGKGNSLLVVGDLLVGKTRAVFESLKTLSDTELLIVKQEYSPKNLTYTPEKTLIFFDDIEEFLAAWGGELKMFITQLLDQGNPILTTCRKGNEYDTLLGGLGSPFINDNFERVEVAKMNPHETSMFQIEYPTLELDTQAYDHTIGSYFLELSTMEDRLRRLGELCKQYDRSQRQHVEGVLKALNLLYYTHNTAGKNLYAQTKVFDFCQRKFTLSREDFDDALMVLTADITHLNFLEVLPHDILYIEEVYLERIVNKGFNVATYFDDLFDLYTSAEVREKGFLTDVYAFSKALREVSFKEAKNIITKMRTLGISPNVVTYNSIIKHCVSYDQAMGVLLEMQAHHLIPDGITYNSIIDKCANYDHAIGVLSEMKAHHLIPNVVTYTSIIKHCVSYDHAMGVLLEMQAHHLIPNEITYNSIIDTCANYDQAMGVLSEMKTHALIPDEITYNSIIPKCESYDHAMEVLSEMKAHRLIPNVVTYNSIIKHTKNYTDAMKVVTLMEQANLKPDAYTLSSVINKIKWGDVKRVRELLERFAGMGVRANDFVIKQVQRKFKITIDKHCREVRP